ncbi:MAG: GNAT family N-acetyltransferase [Bryobacteraceae bacterium]
MSGLPVGPEVDASPAKRPERTTIKGQYVTVAPLDPASHAQALWQGTQGTENAGLWAYLFAGPFFNRDDFDAYLITRAGSEDPLSFAILDNASGRAVGQVALMRIEPEHRSIEVGNVLYTRALQRTRGATETMYLMARYVFEDLGYRRYEWKCNALNEASRRAAMRLGFTFEGIFRQHMIAKGRNRDTAWFSMLDCEWPVRRAGFERWLDPSNFAGNGQQRSSLSML